MCLENGVQINAIDTQFFKVGQLLLNTLKVAAVIIVADKFIIGCAFFRGLFGYIVPVITNISVGGNILFRLLGNIKTVGENLVYNTAVKPRGRGVIFVVNGKLPPTPFV